VDKAVLYLEGMQEQLDRMEIKLAELSSKVDETFKSSEKMRKYFLWTMWITLALIVIPLLILPAVLPSFLASQGVDTSSLQGM
jgi:hypothetical protein